MKYALSVALYPTSILYGRTVMSTIALHGRRAFVHGQRDSRQVSRGLRAMTDQLAPDQQLTPDEAGRLIHLRNEILIMVQEWKKHGWGKGLAARFKALSMVLANEPEPSPGFQNLASRKSALSAEHCQVMINGAMLALAHQAGGRLIVRTHDIFEAHAALGTLAIAIADDDSHVTITGMKEQ